MNLSLTNRYAFFAGCVLITLASLPWLGSLWPLTLSTALLSLIGINDLLQTRQAVRRNYPILGNLRYLIETIRPEIRQYLLENDSDPCPSPVPSARWSMPAPRTRSPTRLLAHSATYTARVSSSSAIRSAPPRTAIHGRSG